MALLRHCSMGPVVMTAPSAKSVSYRNEALGPGFGVVQITQGKRWRKFRPRFAKVRLDRAT